MKKLFCSQYEEADCCHTCHREDAFFKSYYKGFELNHCCTSRHDIEKDIDKHSEPNLENNCE